MTFDGRRKSGDDSVADASKAYPQLLVVPERLDGRPVSPTRTLTGQSLWLVYTPLRRTDASRNGACMMVHDLKGKSTVKCENTSIPGTRCCTNDPASPRPPTRSQ